MAVAARPEVAQREYRESRSAAHSPDPNPGCYDVFCEALGSRWMVGADLSPATLAFGEDDAFESGVLGTLFEFPGSGQIMRGAYLELRWLFAPTARSTRAAGRSASTSEWY